MSKQLRKFIVLLCGLVCIVCLAVGLTACGGSLHKHKYSNDWENDTNNHWHAAICEHTYERSDEASHTYDEDNICTVCGYEKPHKHSFSNDWTTDDFYHWRVATCEHSDEVADKALHVDNNNDNRCDICNLYHEHTYEDEWSYDINAHWHWANCAHIDEKSDEELHIDEDDDEVCDVCEYRIPHSHTYESNWSWDNQYHWKAGICHPTAKAQFAKHTMNTQSRCSVCGAKMAKYDFVNSANGVYTLNDMELPDYNLTGEGISLANVSAGVYTVTLANKQTISGANADSFYCFLDTNENNKICLWKGTVLQTTLSPQSTNVKLQAVIEIKDSDQILYIQTLGTGFSCSVILEEYEYPTFKADGEYAYLPVTPNDIQTKIEIPIDIAPGTYAVEIICHGLLNGGRDEIYNIDYPISLILKSGKTDLTKFTKVGGEFDLAPATYTYTSTIQVNDGDDTITLKCATKNSFMARVKFTSAA